MGDKGKEEEGDWRRQRDIYNYGVVWVWGILEKLDKIRSIWLCRERKREICGW